MISYTEETAYMKVILPQKAKGDTETIRLPKDSDLNRKIKEIRLSRSPRVVIIYYERLCGYHQSRETFILTRESQLPACHEDAVYQEILKFLGKVDRKMNSKVREKKARMITAMEEYSIRPKREHLF